LLDKPQIHQDDCTVVRFAPTASKMAGLQEPAPAKAGVGILDSRFRGKDGVGQITLRGKTLQSS
jgi:hypothetical protein